MATIQTPSIASVVEDQSPVLGGDLDGGDNSIHGVIDISVGTDDGAGNSLLYTVDLSGSAVITEVQAEGGESVKDWYLKSDGSIRVYGKNSLNVIYTSTESIFYTTFQPDTDGLRNNGTNTKRWATTYTSGIATDVETFTSSSNTLDAKNHTCLCDCTSNAVTLNLPAGVSGTQYVVKKIDATANAVTVNANGGELIDGSATLAISTQYDSINVVSDGSNWFLT
jgi:hypothetical protein